MEGVQNTFEPNRVLKTYHEHKDKESLCRPASLPSRPLGLNMSRHSYGLVALEISTSVRKLTERVPLLTVRKPNKSRPSKIQQYYGTQAVGRSQPDSGRNPCLSEDHLHFTHQETLFPAQSQQFFLPISSVISRQRYWRFRSHARISTISNDSMH